MLQRNGAEIDRSRAINSIVRSRDLAGNPVNIRIVQHEGNLISFRDSRGFEYELPEQVEVNILNPGANVDYETIEEDSSVNASAAKSITLKEAWEYYGVEPFFVESYAGIRIQLTLNGITNSKYGWPDNNQPFQEGNLIIQSRPIVEETLLIDLPDNLTNSSLDC